jgi:cytosine/adenosine deaminase-related metal-dependent hydrolase
MNGILSATNIFTGTDRGLVPQASIHYADGLITSVSAGAHISPQTNHLIIPALVNAHDHARPSMTSFGASNMPLGIVDRTLSLRHAARSLSRRRCLARPFVACRLRRRDDSLYPAERQDADRR